MNGRSKRYLRATSRLRPLGRGRKSDVQISNGHPGDGLCYLGRQTMVRSLWLANYSLLELAIIPNGDVTGQSWHSLASLIACVTQFFATNV